MFTTLLPRLFFRRCIATHATAHHLVAGTVVEHRLGGTPTLMLLTQRLGGGRTWVAVDAKGAQHIVRPQQTFSPLSIPSTLTIDDLRAIETRAAAVDREAMHGVWQRLAPQGDAPAQLVDLHTLATAIGSDDGPLACYSVYRALLTDPTYFQLAKRHPRVLFRPRRRPEHNARAVSDDAHASLLATAEAVRALLAGRTRESGGELQEPSFAGQRESHPLLQGDTPVANALASLWRFAAEPTHDVPSAATAMGLLQALGMLPTPQGMSGSLM